MLVVLYLFWNYRAYLEILRWFCRSSTSQAVSPHLLLGFSWESHSYALHAFLFYHFQDFWIRQSVLARSKRTVACISPPAFWQDFSPPHFCTQCFFFWIPVPPDSPARPDSRKYIILTFTNIQVQNSTGIPTPVLVSIRSVLSTSVSTRRRSVSIVSAIICCGSAWFSAV